MGVGGQLRRLLNLSHSPTGVNTTAARSPTARWACGRSVGEWLGCAYLPRDGTVGGCDGVARGSGVRVGATDGVPGTVGVGRTARGDRVGVSRGPGVGATVGVAHEESPGERVGVGTARRVGVAGGTLGVAVGGWVGLQVGDGVGGRVGTGRADGERVGVPATLGVAVGAGGVAEVVGVDAAGPPWALVSAAELPLRAIAVPATATPTTAAAASPPSRIRVIRRFRPTSSIVALRTY